MASKKTIIYIDGSTNYVNAGYGIYIPSLSVGINGHVKGRWESYEIESIAMAKAFEYIEANNLTNCVVMTDNLSCSKDESFESIQKSREVAITWIPREINTIADYLAKQGRLHLTEKLQQMPTKINPQKNISCYEINPIKYIKTKSMGDRYKLYSRVAKTKAERDYVNLLFGKYSNEPRYKSELTEESPVVRLMNTTIGKISKKKLKGKKYIIKSKEYSAKEVEKLLKTVS